MSRRWFGADGIRGPANLWLTPELALSVGRAAARVMGTGGTARILVGRDTRVSGSLLEAALLAGIVSAGGEAVLTGVAPTPAVAMLVRADGFHAGVVLAACYEPFRCNGIRLFGPDGRKLGPPGEDEMEAAMEAPAVPAEEVGTVRAYPGAVAAYVERLLRTVDGGWLDLSGLHVLLDCAHGATYQAAPLGFRAAGALVETVCAAPDGRNINAGCGAADLGFLSSRVAQGSFHLGLAFDGDGDQVQAVDAQGRPVDEDQVLDILASCLPEPDRPPEESPKGDGLRTALHLGRVLAATGRPLAALVGGVAGAPRLPRAAWLDDEGRPASTEKQSGPQVRLRG